MINEKENEITKSSKKKEFEKRTEIQKVLEKGTNGHKLLTTFI